MNDKRDFDAMWAAIPTEIETWQEGRRWHYRIIKGLLQTDGPYHGYRSRERALAAARAYIAREQQREAKRNASRRIDRP